MGLAIRIRVTWQGDVVEDVVHEGFRAVRVGAGARATVVAPGEPDRLVRFRRGPRGYRLEVPEGAAEQVVFPGEEPLEGAALAGGMVRPLALGPGRVVIGGTEVDWEVLRTDRDHSLLYLGGGLTAVALLALLAGSLYKIVRQWGDGREARWGEAVALGADQAKFLRITLDPGAQGASRVAAGQGLAHHGVQSALLVRPTRPDKPVAPTEKAPVRKRVKRAPRAVERPDEPATAVAVAHRPEAVPRPVNEDSDEDADDSDDDTADKAQLIADGQQALLAAELRSAIDSLTAAEKTDKLDYDNLNWLGLAHYFVGEYDRAEGRWREAMAMDAARPDAVNNLGGVAKRRGDAAGEIAYYQKALELRPGDCHALNSLSLAQAKQGRIDEALRTLAESDTACGGNYAYTYIQRAGILALAGKTADAMAELEKGLARVDTLIPIKEYEVEADLLLDPAFAPLRCLATFDPLTAKYLPRAVTSKAAILTPKPPAAPAAPQIPIFEGGDDEDNQLGSVAPTG